MGRRNLSQKEALAGLVGLGLAAIAFAGICGGDRDESAGESSPSASSTASPTSSPSPTPSPTPDLLGPPPADADSAQRALEQFLGPSIACAPELTARWNAVCASADVDGDTRPDLVLLVPLAGPALRSPEPAVVLVRRAATGIFDRFPGPETEADESIFGRSIFGAVDRTGDGRPDVVLLSNVCNPNGCLSRVQVQSWDGTAWRDAGQDDLGVDNVDRVAFDGTGSGSRLTVHGGTLKSPAAGPVRAKTFTYRFNGTRYHLETTEPDAASYLWHSIVEADTAFDQAKFADALALYRAAVAAAPALKDWKRETAGTDGNTSLVGYALFRSAVATAAIGDDPTVALDEVISKSKEQLFINAAEVFRRGYQEQGGVRGGCLAVSSYLATDPIPDILRAMFDYGLAYYPIKTSRDICPL